MEAYTDLITRRSVRRYKNTPVPRELIERVINAGLHAPSGLNKQSSIIVAVTDRSLRDRIAQLNAAAMGRDTDPFYGAPVVLVVLANKKVPTYIYDGSLTMGNLMLAAHECGLGSCWIHRAREVFDSDEGREILANLGISGDYEGIGNCILGFADTELPEPAERREGRVFWAE